MESTLLDLGTNTTTQALLITKTGKEMNEFWDQTLDEIGFKCSYTSFTDWQDVFNTEPPQLILLDGSQQPNTAKTVCREICHIHPAIPIIAILTRADMAERGALWHSAGAQNFLRLDATRMELETILENQLKTTRLEKELAALKLQIINSHQYDTITQFLTRRHFFFDAHRECARARRYGHSLSCMMININYYEDYEKSFGKPCSIYLLRTISNLIRQWTRESDIVARFAPNKIVALLPETDIYGAVMVRERVLEAFENLSCKWEGKPLPVSISIGEAERSHTFDSQLPDLENLAAISVREEIAQLLEDADNALKIAQKSSPRPEMFIEYSHAELPE